MFNTPQVSAAQLRFAMCCDVFIAELWCLGGPKRKTWLLGHDNDVDHVVFSSGYAVNRHHVSLAMTLFCQRSSLGGI